MEISEVEFLEGITNLEMIDFSHSFNGINAIGDTIEYIGYGTDCGTGDCHTDCYCNGINILDCDNKTMYCTQQRYFYFNKIYPTFAEITVVDYLDFSRTIMFAAKRKDKIIISSTIRNAICVAINYSTSIDEIKQQFLNRVKEESKLTVREYIDWHAKLTGCCATGGHEYVADLGLDLHKEVTLYEFLKITIADPVNGHVIRHIFYDEIKANPQYFK